MITGVKQTPSVSNQKQSEQRKNKSTKKGDFQKCLDQAKAAPGKATKG